MHIIRVVPLAALPITLPQVLDYFWTDPLPQGSLVTVLVGRRSVSALVLESLDLEQAKMRVKKSGFSLKKITNVTSTKPHASPEQLALARWMALHYYAPLGLCLKTVLRTS